jgi:hypothetical protein
MRSACSTAVTGRYRAGGIPFRLTTKKELSDTIWDRLEESPERFQRSGKKIQKNAARKPAAGPGGRILPSMKPARSRAHWIGPPSLTGLWLEALLRMLAMLMSNAATVSRMRPSRLSRECHTDAMPAMLPGEARGPMEKQPAAENSQSNEALTLSSTRSVRRVYPELVEGSNHEGGLTIAANDADRPPAAAERTGTRTGFRTGAASKFSGNPPMDSADRTAAA